MSPDDKDLLIIVVLGMALLVFWMKFVTGRDCPACEGRGCARCNGRGKL